MTGLAELSLDALIADRTQRLTAYQNTAYAQRYTALVRELAAAERSCVGGDRMSREVAISLYKLMAYKDEYEVGRLYAQSDFYARVAQQFDGTVKLRFHLAPPVFAKRDNAGHLIKRQYGSWMRYGFALLSRLRWLRGSWADPFGYLADRRAERAAIAAYETEMRELVTQLTAANLEVLVELAQLPQTVRGFGHVKEQNARRADLRRTQLMARLRQPLAVAA